MTTTMRTTVVAPRRSPENGHASWCDARHCTPLYDEGFHTGRTTVFIADGDPDDPTTRVAVELTMRRFDNPDDATIGTELLSVDLGGSTLLPPLLLTATDRRRLAALLLDPESAAAAAVR